VVNLTNLNGIISEEVVNDEWEIIKSRIEPQNATIVVKELLLALNTATTEGFFHILLEGWVAEYWLRDLLVGKAIHWDCLRLALSVSESLNNDK
jgi:hypothetical protein